MAVDMPPGPVPDWLLNLIAGGLGGAVRAITQPEQSWWHRITTSFVGGISAMYLTPIMVPIVQDYLVRYEVPYGSVAGFCGFLLGISGLSACELAIRLIRKRVSPDKT